MDKKSNNKSLVVIYRGVCVCVCVFEDLIQILLTFYATPCAKDDDDDVL
jgi:hypothetical protein